MYLYFVLQKVWASQTPPVKMNNLPTESESASAAQRVVAQFIDTTLILIIASIPASLVQAGGAVGIVIAILFLVLSLGYRLLGDAIFGGAGFGKRILGIYVVDSATRQPCSLGQAAIRMGVLVFPFAYLIEPVILACDGQQRWGDRVAHTYVLRRHPKVAPPSAPLRPINFAALRESVERGNPER